MSDNLITLPAAADLSTYQYRSVSIDANGRVNILATVGGTAIGILESKPTAIDVPCVVRIGGQGRMKVNQAVNDGVLLTNNIQGFGVPAGTAGAFCIAQTLRSTGGSADIVDVVVMHINNV